MSAVADAQESAWLSARILAGSDRAAARTVLDTATTAVLVRVVSRVLPDGEAGFWRLVQQEIES